MAEHHPVSVDPEALRQAQDFWGKFTQAIKWSSIVTAVILAVMALVFID